MALSMPLIAAVGIGIVVGGGAVAIANRDAEPQQREAIEAVVRNYILDHPELIEESKQRLAMRDTGRVIQGYRHAIETPFAGAWAGNPKGDVVVTLFTDYGCGYCRKSAADVDRLLASDANVRMVWREIPILGPASEQAARAALLAAQQNRYLDFHRRMFSGGPPSDARIIEVGRAVGLQRGVGNGITEEINRNMALANALGISGTPSFVVGNQLLNGAVGYDALVEAVANARKKG